MAQRFSGQRPWRRSRELVKVAAPAAGADWSLTVPAGHIYEVMAAYAQLVTAVAAADRAPVLVVTDGIDRALALPSAAVQAASLTRGYTWGMGLTGAAIGAQQSMGLPPLFLLPGWTLAVATANIQAADQWGAAQLLVVDTEWRGGNVNLGEVPDLVMASIAAGMTG